jgi:uncharacterized protein (DUF1697 family)
MNYLLLLRGVNVGGNRRVVMADLRAQFTAAGASMVRTYINSGNLLFNYAGVDAATFAADVLASHYDFPIGSLVLSAPQLAANLAAIPAWWGQDDTFRHNALFKLPGYAADFDELIRSQLTAYDRVAFTPDVIFWSSPQKVNYSRAFYAKMLPEPFYPFVSIRNRNTTLKLGAMLAAMAEEQK